MNRFVRPAGGGGLRAVMQARRKPFTLIELLIVIAIIAILAGLLIPAVSSSRNRARLATCVGNLHEVSLMHLYYADACDSFFCPAWDVSFDQWDSSSNHRGPGILSRIVPDSSAAKGRVFECPAAKTELYTNLAWTARFAGYGLNYLLSFPDVQSHPPRYRPCRTTDVKFPSRIVMLADSACFLSGNDGRPSPTAFLYNPTSGRGGYADFRHSGTCPTAFVDGHATAWNQFTPRRPDKSGWEERVGYLAPDDSIYDPFTK